MALIYKTGLKKRLAIYDYCDKYSSFNEAMTRRKHITFPKKKTVFSSADRGKIVGDSTPGSKS